MTKSTHIITGLNDGGAEAVLYRLCTHDDPARHHVISMMDGGKYGPMLQEAGVRVTCLDMPRGRISISGLWKLHRLLRQQRPEVVQTWMYHANLVGGFTARATGISKVYWGIHHTELNPDDVGRNTRWVSNLCALLSRFVPASIVACAERARAVHVNMGYDARKFTVIPNGYDVTRFQPDIAGRDVVRQEWGVGPGMILLGLVGRWNSEKDHPNLLAAFSRLAASRSEIRLLLAGTGCTGDNVDLVNSIARHGLSDRVILAGRRDDVPALMNALDLHILSSKSEAFPNVVAEAMACGTPCVVTDVGDAALIVGDTGWVVPPRDPAALAEALATALDERKDRSAWASRQARARARIVENFSLEKMVARYQGVWDEDAAKEK